jgi:anti-anti-sigma regulatory factor
MTGAAADRREVLPGAPGRLLADQRRGVPVASMRHGDHICAAFDARAQQEELIIDFVRGGLEAGDRVWCLARGDRAEDVLERLDAAGLAIDKPLVRGQLEVFDAGQSPVAGSAFDPERTLAALEGAVNGALSSGYGGIRLTSELGFAGGAQLVGQQPESWEARLSDFYAARPAIGFCQYDRRQIEEDRLASLLGMHPARARLPRVSDRGLLRVIDANDAGTRLRVAGAADLSSSPVLAEAICEALGDAGDIHIDASRLEFIDLSGAGELIKAALKMPPGRRIVVYDPPRSFRRILEVMPGYDALLDVVP